MIFCATQEFSYMFEVVAQSYEFVPNFTREIPASNVLAKVSTNGFGYPMTQATTESLCLFLVGGLEHFLFFHILVIIIPIDFHIFQRG